MAKKYDWHNEYYAEYRRLRKQNPDLSHTEIFDILPDYIDRDFMAENFMSFEISYEIDMMAVNELIEILKDKQFQTCLKNL